MINKLDKFPKKCLIAGTYLQVANGSIEGIVAQASLLVQEFSSLAIGWWGKQAIVEALFEFLEKARQEGELSWAVMVNQVRPLTCRRAQVVRVAQKTSGHGNG